MKGIVKITQRLVSLFLVLVASSMIFLSSPAIAAATSSLVTVTDENFETEVIESGKSKPVIVILASEDCLLYQSENYLVDAKAQAEKFYGDGYQIVVGKTENNNQILRQTELVPTVPEFPPPPIILGSKNGKLTSGYAFQGDSSYHLIEGELQRLP